MPKPLFWWLWSECSPLPIPNREVKPHIADDTALVCGKVGRRQFFIRAFQFGMLFFLRKFRDLATPTLLHFGNAQASLALRSTSAASIMGEVRYCQRLRTPVRNKKMKVSNSLMKTFFTGLDSIQRCYSLHYSYFQGAHGYTTVPLTGYPQEAEVAKPANTRKDKNNKNEQLFVATERNAKLRYEGYKKLSEM